MATLEQLRHTRNRGFKWGTIALLICTIPAATSLAVTLAHYAGNQNGFVQALCKIPGVVYLANEWPGVFGRIIPELGWHILRWAPGVFGEIFGILCIVAAIQAMGELQRLQLRADEASNIDRLKR